MSNTIKRVVLYASLAAICYAIAIYWTDSQAAFVGVFVTGAVIGVTADLMFWWHVLRLGFKRHRQ